MDLFIDTANLKEIEEIAQWGVVKGVTTNPKIFSQEEGADLKTRVFEILKLVPGPLSVEVTTNDFEEMVEEASVYAAWSPYVVVKLPMNENGLRALKVLKGYSTKIIVGSIRHLQHINQAAEAGAHITTVPYKFFREMARHPQTDKTIDEFLEAWNKIKVPIA
ncbi:MAG: hypothetical protein HZC17_02550 [Candidatus Omnitrophica bacterium]|nr:hypothetical protein [Candidatus Omnitrophota bacterium]